MAWHVAPSQFCPASSPWAVVRDVDGSIVACHVTRDDAQGQMAALYAHQELEGFSPQKDGGDDEYPVGNVSQRDGSTFAGAVADLYPGGGGGSCSGTCQTGCADCNDDEDEDFGEGANGAYDNGHGKPDGTPDEPPPYATIDPPKLAIMNQVPWQQTGPAMIPCPYTTPTTQLW